MRFDVWCEGQLSGTKLPFAVVGSMAAVSEKPSTTLELMLGRRNILSVLNPETKQDDSSVAMLLCRISRRL